MTEKSIISKRSGKTRKKYNYYNFAPVMEGGEKIVEVTVGKRKKKVRVRRHGGAYIIAKTHVSDIDFVDCPGERGHGGRKCVRNPRNIGFSRYTTFAKTQFSALISLGFSVQTDNVFTAGDGIKFGLEVCLDHLEEVLKAKNDQNDLGVQVQIVTSAGMEIERDAVIATGPVFLQDGGSKGARTQYLCPRCRVHQIVNSKVETIWHRNRLPDKIFESPIRTRFVSVQNKRKIKSMHNRVYSSARTERQWYSAKGFASEGTGLGFDPRFMATKMNNLFQVFASDNYNPQINIGPVFKLTR